MFASWNKARGASLVAAAAAAGLCVLSTPAHALEGVQGRHAIFYPSLELVYQHDDNFFLENGGEHSAETFIAHAHFKLVVPGSRQFVQLEYAPQWRNVNVSKHPTPMPYDPEHMSHFWNLNARLKGSSVFGCDINQTFTLGSLEGYELDPNLAELIRNNHSPFWRHDLGVNFKWDGSKQGAVIMTGKENTSFDDSDTAPSWFEIDGWRLGAEYHYKFAPLTKFLLGYMYKHQDQDYTLAARLDGFPDTVGSIENKLWFGFDGELGRTTTGRATVGFHSLNYDGTAPDWQGFTASADIVKSFSRWTKLAFAAERAPNFSAYSVNANEMNNYYVSNRASFTLSNQPQGSRVGWTVIGQFQRNGWDQATLEPTTGGVSRREDDLVRLRGEIGFHALEHLSFRLNFERKDNDSNHDSYDFVDNLVILQVQFGF